MYHDQLNGIKSGYMLEFETFPVWNIHLPSSTETYFIDDSVQRSLLIDPFTSSLRNNGQHGRDIRNLPCLEAHVGTHLRNLSAQLPQQALGRNFMVSLPAGGQPSAR